MPENMINARRSIHEYRESQTPQPEPQEENHEDDGRSLNCTKDQITTTSGSESEEFDDADEDKNHSPTAYERQPNFNVSRSVPRTLARPKPKRVNVSPKPNTPKYTKPLSPRPAPAERNIKNSGVPKYVFIIVLLASIACYFCLSNADSKVKNCSFEVLHKRYPQQNPTVWKTLTVGIELILNKRTQQPAVYLFVHQGGDHVLTLIKDVVVHSSACFGKEMLPVEMESSDFLIIEGDYGYAIEKYKAKIKQGNVILIANLNEIPAGAARALHTICDTYSPIVKDVVIFLTLTIPPNKEGNKVAQAEEFLYDLWGSKLYDNELDPLITRVTDQVIDLQN